METFVQCKINLKNFFKKFDCLSEQVQKIKLFFFPDEAQYEIFTDPITGKQYIRTEDGELLEIVVGEDGKTYLKTKSGKLRGISFANIRIGEK